MAMLIRRTSVAFALAAAILPLGGGGVPTSEAQQAFKRTVLRKADLADLENREGVMVLVELPPGAEAGRHTHPGTELGYLVEGSAVVEVEGEPPMAIEAGDTWIIGPGKVHNAKGTGDSPARIVVTYVVEK